MIRLHHVPQSRSMRCLWLLHELDIPFTVETYTLDKTLRQPPYSLLNPAGRVPTLEIDGQVIQESGAILQVLCERFSPDGLGRVPGHAERADWLNWVHFAETISQHTAQLTQQHVFIRDDATRSALVMKLEAARLARTLAFVDQALRGDYLLPGGFSAADIGIGQAVYMAQHFVELAPLPRLEAWFTRLAARPAYKAALGEERGLYRQAFYPPWPGPA